MLQVGIAFVSIGLALGSIAAGAAAEEIQVSATLLKIIEAVEVPARQSGVLRQVEVQEGSIVQHGELIAQIDNEEKSLEVDQARVELEIARREASNDINVRFARKSLEVAEAELLRSREALSIAAKSVSQTEMDRLKLLVEKSRLEIEQSTEKMAIDKLTANLRETELKLAESRLNRHEIRSPLEGMVVTVFRRQGEWVETSDPVAKVVRIDRLRAEGFMPSEKASLQLIGQPAEISVEFPGRDPLAVTGKVVFVDPEVDPVNGQVRVWVELENLDLRLRPGLRADMRILHSP